MSWLELMFLLSKVWVIFVIFLKGFIINRRWKDGVFSNFIVFVVMLYFLILKYFEDLLISIRNVFLFIGGGRILMKL